jgi:hypothetical protein
VNLRVMLVTTVLVLAGCSPEVENERSAGSAVELPDGDSFRLSDIVLDEEVPSSLAFAADTGDDDLQVALDPDDGEELDALLASDPSDDDELALAKAAPKKAASKPGAPKKAAPKKAAPKKTAGAKSSNVYHGQKASKKIAAGAAKKGTVTTKSGRKLKVKKTKQGDQHLLNVTQPRSAPDPGPAGPKIPDPVAAGPVPPETNPFGPMGWDPGLTKPDVMSQDSQWCFLDGVYGTCGRRASGSGFWTLMHDTGDGVETVCTPNTAGCPFNFSWQRDGANALVAHIDNNVTVSHGNLWEGLAEETGVTGPSGGKLANMPSPDTLVVDAYLKSTLAGTTPDGSMRVNVGMSWLSCDRRQPLDANGKCIHWRSWLLEMNVANSQVQGAVRDSWSLDADWSCSTLAPLPASWGDCRYLGARIWTGRGVTMGDITSPQGAWVHIDWGQIIRKLVAAGQLPDSLDDHAVVNQVYIGTEIINRMHSVLDISHYTISGRRPAGGPP